VVISDEGVRIRALFNAHTVFIVMNHINFKTVEIASLSEIALKTVLRIVVVSKSTFHTSGFFAWFAEISVCHLSIYTNLVASLSIN